MILLARRSVSTVVYPERIWTGWRELVVVVVAVSGAELIIELSMLEAVDIWDDIAELSIIDDDMSAPDDASMADDDMSPAGAEDDAIIEESIAEEPIAEDSIVEDEDDWANAPVASTAASAVPTRSCRVIIVVFLREAGPPKSG